MRLASRFGRYNSIRRERPLTDDELMQFCSICLFW
ncbi:YubP [Escherichia coli]|nr:YubP [Escherichia coli]